MHESMELRETSFRFPHIEAERGEFERVAKTFNIDVDTLIFLAEEEGRLVELDDDLWGKVENTRSYHHVTQGDWNGLVNAMREDNEWRDWEYLKQKMERRETLDAPIVAHIDGVYHLVSGNTRLMVARALGIKPGVLIFSYRHDRTDEAT